MIGGKLASVVGFFLIASCGSGLAQTGTIVQMPDQIK